MSLATDEPGKGSMWGQYIGPFGLYNSPQWTRGQEQGMGVVGGASVVWRVRRGAFYFEPVILARAGVLEG